MKHNKKAGFTLIELLVVIAIIGALSSVVMASLNGARTKARNAERLQTVDQINKAMEIYSTASGTNSLPYVKKNDGTWRCLGWDGVAIVAGCTLGTSPTNITAPEQVAYNNLIGTYISGGKIPMNPFYLPTDSKSFYRYISGTNGFAVTSICGAAGTCTQAGAYLLWAMEGASANCGRGVLFATTAKDSTCVLRVGSKI